MSPRGIWLYTTQLCENDERRGCLVRPKNMHKQHFLHQSVELLQLQLRGIASNALLFNRHCFSHPSKELMDVNSKYVIGDKEIGSGHYGVVRTCTSRGTMRLAKRGMEALLWEAADNSTCQILQSSGTIHHCPTSTEPWWFSSHEVCCPQDLCWSLPLPIVDYHSCNSINCYTRAEESSKHEFSI